jgi:hypothetical protein
LLARVTISEDRCHVLVENIPPNISIDEAASASPTTQSPTI